MNKFGCIVVDDEPLARRLMVEYISNLDYLEMLEEFRTGLDAKNYIEAEKVDVIFLDINMPGLTGLELLRNINSDALVIFTTAYPEYAVEAFEFSAFDYLVKPISFERFLKAMDKVKNQLSIKALKLPQRPKLIVKENKRLYQIIQSDILYIQAYGDYVKIRTTSKQYVAKEKLSGLIQYLMGFIIQCHRSYFINVNQIEYIEGNLAMVKGDMIPISLSFRTEVLSAFQKGK